MYTILHWFGYYFTPLSLLYLLFAIFVLLGPIWLAISTIKEFFQGKWLAVGINVGAIIGFVVVGLFMLVDALDNFSKEKIYEDVSSDYKAYVKYRKEDNKKDIFFEQNGYLLLHANEYVVTIEDGKFCQFKDGTNEVSFSGECIIDEIRVFRMLYSCRWDGIIENPDLSCRLSVDANYLSQEYDLNYSIPISYRNNFDDINLSGVQDIDSLYISSLVNESTRIAGELFKDAILNRYFLNINDNEAGYFSNIVKTIKEVSESKEGTFEDFATERIKSGYFNSYEYYTTEFKYPGSDINIKFVYSEDAFHTKIEMKNIEGPDNFQFVLDAPMILNKSQYIDAEISYFVNGNDYLGFFFDNCKYTFKVPYSYDDTSDIKDLKTLDSYKEIGNEKYNDLLTLIDNCIKLSGRYFSYAVYDQFGIKLKDSEINYFNYSDEPLDINKIENNTTYTITYVLDGGTLDKPINTYKFNEEIPFGFPSKIGTNTHYYSFDGWYLDEKFENEITSTKGINSDITIYAKYSLLPRTFNIDYVLNGGSLSSGDILPDSYIFSDGNIELPILTRDGYKFWGYSFERYPSYSDCFMEIETSYNKDLKVYAIFEKGYSVEWDLDGGNTDSTLIDMLYSEVDQIDFTNINPVKEGATFQYFEVTSENEKINIHYGGTSSNKVFKLLLNNDNYKTNYYCKAVFKENYKITIVSKGGILSQNEIIISGTDIIYFDTPTKEKTRCSGYSLRESSRYEDERFVVEYDSGKTHFNPLKIESNLTIYAIWNESVITFVTNSNCELEPKTTYNHSYKTSPLELPTPTTDDERIFLYWAYYNEKNDSYTEFESIIVENDITLYAVWYDPKK